MICMPDNDFAINERASQVTMLDVRASCELDHFARNYHEVRTKHPDFPELGRQCNGRHHALKSR